MYLIVGLGNPGREYKYTRHNTGYEVIDKLAYDFNIDMSKSKFSGIAGEGRIGAEKVILLKPVTYMNLSGVSVKEAMSFYKLDTDRLIVCCDDINLPVGSIRIRKSGSDGGQKGLRNIIYHLNREDFCRVRVGVGEKPAGWDLADWVLSRFSNEEGESIVKGITDAGDGVKVILESGVNEAMNRFNRKNKAKENDGNV